jgi:16S rRNA U516 pseudouridylate synthase RsuA-like enzyme
VLHTDILLEGEDLDAPFPVAVMVNKPVGYVVTAPDDDKILDPKVYDLLPYR